MRGRARKFNTLEYSVDERNRKLELQLFSTCRESRKQDYIQFIDRYKNKPCHKVEEDRTGSKCCRDYVNTWRYKRHSSIKLGKPRTFEDRIQATRSRHYMIYDNPIDEISSAEVDEGEPA